MNRLAAMGLSLVLGLGACAKKPDRNEAAGSAAVEIMPRAEQLRGEDPETSAKTVTDLQRSARKIIANCVTSTAALAMKGCPQQGL